MAFLRLLLYGGLIFIFATALSADENTEDIIDTSITYNNFLDVIPMHYNVILIPYFKENDEIYDEYLTFLYLALNKYIKEHQASGRVIFYGEMNVTIHILHPTIKISLNSSNSIFYLSIELMEKDVINLKPEEYYSHVPKKIEYDNVTQICVLHFKNELLPTNYTLKLKFLNAINTSEDDNIILKTTYIKKSGNEKWLNKTNFPMIEAQRLFPYWDKPTIRATFNVSVKHHCNYSVFSNMPIKEILKYKLNNTETCIQWTYFDTTSSIPAHLVMVMISSKRFFPNNCTDKVYLWRNSNSQYIQFAERISNKAIMKLKFEWFKSLKKLKIPKIQLVVTPDFRNNINMNFGLVAIRETSIIYDENIHSVAHKIEAAKLIARGIAYQWFSHLINPTWWSNLWISDGLITLFGMETVNAINALEHYTNSEILDLFIVQTQYESLQLDDYNLTQALTSEIGSPPEINSLSSYSRYIKAPLILRMLQYLITKEVFWKGVHRYLNINALNSVTPDDFWPEMQIAVNESYPQAKVTLLLTDLINGWTKFMNYPILKIMRNYSANTMDITVENHDLFAKDEQWIAITFTTQSNLNFMNFASPFYDERLIFILPSFIEQVDIVEDGWVMFNLQQTGYYRVNYDLINWERIAKYLNSREYIKVHVLNRAKIIDDAFHFMITQQLNSSIFWSLTKYLAQETNYIAWFPMIKAIEYMSRIFPFIYTDKRVNDIKSKLNYIFRGLLSKIKFREKSEEDEFTKCLRQEAIKWACILGNTICQKIAYDRLFEHIRRLKNNKYYKLLPCWKEWIYCKGLMLADFHTWHIIKNIELIQNHDNRFLEFLACSKNNINEYLKLITPLDNGTYIGIQANNSISSFFFIIAKHAKNDTVLKNILINFEKLKPRDISDLAAFTIIINHVYSKNQFDEIKHTFDIIMGKKAYLCVTEIISNKNKTDKETHQARLTECKNRLDHWRWCIEKKIEIRLSEIEKNKEHIQKFL